MPTIYRIRWETEHLTERTLIKRAWAEWHRCLDDIIAIEERNERRARLSASRKKKAYMRSIFEAPEAKAKREARNAAARAETVKARERYIKVLRDLLQPSAFRALLTPEERAMDPRSAYLSAAKRLHPDVGGDAEAMTELNELWNMLKETL